MGVDGDLWITGVPGIVGLDQLCRAPGIRTGGIAVGPDVVAGSVGLSPHRDGVAVGVEGDLWITGIPGIVGFDQLCRAPARIWGIAVGPDVVAGSVVLAPNRDGVASGVEGDLRTIGIPGIVGFDQLRRAPTRIWGIAVGPDVVAGSVVLSPHRDGIAVGVHGDLWVIGTPGIVGFDQLRRAPGIRTGGIAVGPDVVAGAVGLAPHRDGVAVGVDGDLRSIGTPGIVGFDQLGFLPTGIGPRVIAAPAAPAGREGEERNGEYEMKPGFLNDVGCFLSHVSLLVRMVVSLDTAGQAQLQHCVVSRKSELFHFESR